MRTLRNDPLHHLRPFMVRRFLVSTRRTFNLSQRRTLFDQADGMCCECGQPLPERWHADHVVPFSRGGSTTVGNGQALCPSCNLRKGATVVSNGNGSELRKWQAEALIRIDRLYGKHQRNFLVEACPGAGKTRLAIEVLKSYAFSENRRVIVVVPSDALREQWTARLHSYGGAFAMPRQNGETWKPQAISAVVTYAGLQAINQYLRSYMERSGGGYVVVFDEIHHASVGALGNVWGTAVNAVFRDNPRVHMTLSMSGTPFRADGCPIAFLKYIDGVAVADVTYGYQDALEDGVVRPVLFYGQIGEIDWIDRDGERQTHSTSAEVADDRVEAQRYNLATRSGSLIARSMADAAIAHLNELRRDDRDAGMIVFAPDQESAGEWRNWFQQKVKDQVALVTSDTLDSRQQLETFTKGTNSIIVCVDMIGEGVDIPRLRVAVYLGRVRDSESKLWQYLGRIMRVPADEINQSCEAKWYMVQDPKLRAWAMKIRRAVNAVAEQRDASRLERTRSHEPGRGLVALSTHSTGEEVFPIHMQLHVTQDVWTAVERSARAVAPSLNSDWFTIAKRLLAVKGVVVPDSIPHPESTDTYQQEKEAKAFVHQLARRYGGMLTDMHSVNRYGYVWEQLKRIDGRTHADCTTEHYLRRIETLKTWIAAGGRYHER